MTRGFRPNGGTVAGRGRAGAAGVRPRAVARRKDAPGYVRPLMGLVTVAVIAGIVVLAATLFRGDFTQTVPVTVLSPRAGLVMNPEAKVKMRGVQVGKVDSIDSLPGGQAALHLAMDPSQLHFIPANVLVDIASTTVFGAKFVELVPPESPSATRMHAGQVLDGQHVTVEINTVFQDLTALLAKIDPAKLNETLGALAQAFSGRGDKLGQTLTDFDSFLAKVNPSLPRLAHDIAVTPVVVNAYADAAPDLVKTADSATRISQTIVDEQRNFDRLLTSAIGLADVGNDVVGTNRKALTDVLQLLVPTTNETNEYNMALYCGIKGIAVLTHYPQLPVPGVLVSASLTFGAERYRYPTNLPKVAATGGPHCMGLPQLPPFTNAKYLVSDVGANPWAYGNPQLLINSDALKQLLYGPIAGPPRNDLQIGQPG